MNTQSGMSKFITILIIAAVLGAGLYWAWDKPIMGIFDGREGPDNGSGQEPGGEAPDSEEPGSGNAVIKGSIIYPSEFIPAQTVCAENVDDESEAYCMELGGQEDRFFALEVPPGEYFVYAMLSGDAGQLVDYKAYYNEFVECGIRVGCEDTAKIAVEAEAGETVENIKPHDWYHVSQAEN